MHLASETLLKAKHAGFDAEMSGGIHALQGNINQTLQVATEDKVFIFDIPSLAKNNEFKVFLERLFCENNDQILIGHSCSGDLKVIHSIIRTNRKIKPIVDIQKWHKTKKNMALKDIVFEYFKKPFSKFEQCSGWDNRPLRRAQLHYAALDALVLLKIYTNSGTLID